MVDGPWRFDVDVVSVNGSVIEVIIEIATVPILRKRFVIAWKTWHEIVVWSIAAVELGVASSSDDGNHCENDESNAKDSIAPECACVVANLVVVTPNAGGGFAHKWAVLAAMAVDALAVAHALFFLFLFFHREVSNHEGLLY
jgi:hypothetical protein